MKNNTCITYVCVGSRLQIEKFDTEASSRGHIAVDEEKPCTNLFSSCYTQKHVQCIVILSLNRQISLLFGCYAKLYHVIYYQGISFV